MELSFIVIDDTELDHFIAKKMIGNANKLFDVINFYDAPLALQFIAADMATGVKVVVIFLDIYMPLMNGFEFIEEFEKLDSNIKDKYYIVALTSTREISDLRRIKASKTFKALLNKPVTSEEMKMLLNKVATEYNLQLT